MAIYNIKVELSDYGVWHALEYDNGEPLSSGNYMDVKDALFEALKKVVDKEDLDRQEADYIDDPQEKAQFLSDRGHEIWEGEDQDGIRIWD